LRPLKAHCADLAAVVILLLILTVLFSDVLFFGSNFYVRDVPLLYYPSRRVLHDIVAAGHFPYWNPRISTGQPLAANPAYETFYPFQWFIFLPNFDLGFRLTIVLHFYLAAIGTYLLLRSLGTRIWAALFGALTFALGGMFVSLASLLAFLFSAAWLPWIAFFWRRSNVPATALSLGMLLLAADQSMILQAGALVVAYGVYRKISLRSLAIVLVAAFLVGAVQLIPALDLQAESGRSQPLPYETAAASSLRPYRLLELTFPNLDAWHSKELTLIWSHRSQGEFAAPLIFSFYPGLLAGVLIVAGMICRSRGWMFVGAWSAASYLLALGRYGPFFRVLYAAGIRSIRYPEKFFVSAIFVLSIFAALVFDDLDRNPRLRQAVLTLVAIISATSAALYLYAYSEGYARAFAAVWSQSNPLFITASRRGWLLSAATSAALLVLVLLQRRLGNRAFGLLTAFVLVDLGSRISGLAPRIERGYYDPPPAAQVLAREGRPIRIYNNAAEARLRVPMPNLPLQARVWATRNGMIPRMEEIWGFGGAFEEDIDLTALTPTRDLARTFHEVASSRPDRAALILAQAAVTHVALLQIPAIENEMDVRAFNYVRFDRFPGNDRFWFADQMISDRRMLWSNSAISRYAAFVEQPPFQPAFGRVVKATETPNAIDLDVEANGQALLVIAVTRHKYWKGIVDGMPSPPHPANGAFQCFVVQPGKHHVALRYRNPAVMIFGVVSLLSVVTLLAACRR